MNVSTDIFVCNLPYIQPGDCLVSNASTTQSNLSVAALEPICGNNKTGRLCQRCVAGLKNVGGHCRDCSDPAHVAASVFVCLGVAVVVMLGFEFLLRPSESSSEQPLMALLQVIFDFVQVIGLLAAIRFHWSPVVVGMFTVARSGTGFGLFDLDCAASWDAHTTLVVSTLSLPIMLSLLAVHVCLKYLCYVWNRSVPLSLGLFDWIKSRRLNRAFPSAVKNIFTLVSPSIATTSFRHFQCVKMDGNASWVVSNLEERCWSAEWWAWSVPAFIGVLVVLLPPLHMIRVLGAAKAQQVQPDEEVRMPTTQLI